MKLRFAFISKVVLVLSMPLLVWAAEMADPVVLNQERQLKEDTERQAQMICDSVFGPEKSSVLVSVELGLESNRKGGSAVDRKLDNKGGGLGADNYILPWVPAPKSVTKEETPKDAKVETQAAQQTTVDVKTVIRRFDIIVVHDDTITEPRVELARQTLESAFDRYKEILNVVFRPTSFVHDSFQPGETVKKNFWDSLTLKNFLLLFLLLLVFWLMKFFFGPLAKFMSDYIEGMKELNKSKVEMDTKSESENETDETGEQDTNGEGAGEGELTPEEQAALEAEEAAMEKYEPFTYINDENVKQLAYLLHEEEPWVVALVLSYLSSDHAFKVMEVLPADLQAKVALETAMFRQTSLDQVMAIDADIKEKIDYVVGGLGKLVGILENSDRFSRENILEYLKNEKPNLYEKVREQILLFDDFVKFPKMAMQVIVRELKIEDVGVALREASPELQQKFFENMSQGAVTLLKEEIEFGRQVTNDQIEEERRKIVDYVKKLEADGKISFRHKGQISALTGDEMGTETPELSTSSVLAGARRGGNSEEAVTAFATGSQLAEQGNNEEALPYFEQAVQLNSEMVEAQQALANTYYALGRYEEAVGAYDQALALQPNDELQSWVDELKASLTTKAS